MKVDSQDGLSLLEVLTTLGILSILTSIYLLQASDQLKAMAIANSDSEIEDLRTYIDRNLSCQKTLNPPIPACSTSEVEIPAKDGKGQTFPQRFGSIGMRVKCVHGGTRLRVETIKYASATSTDPGSHLLTGKKNEWSDIHRGIPAWEVTTNNAPVQTVLDFEAVPSATVGKALSNDAFAASHGVRFRPIDSNGNQAGAMAIRRVVHQGESQPPDSQEAWLCVKCPGKPSRNRMMNSNEEQRVGRGILSTTNATNNKISGVEIEYLHPAMNPSFDLIDVDGGEAWTITPFDEANRPLTQAIKTIKVNGYNKNKSFTGQAMNIQLNTGTTPIKKIVLKGTKNISYFGFAFDNFKTGIVQNPIGCAAGGVSSH